MKKSFLIIFCAAAAFALTACAGDDNEKSCNTSKDCGDATLYKCNIVKHVCEERFPAHCANNLKDNGETDVDCGSVCGNEKLCTLDKACTTNADCSSKNCAGNKCVAATCTEDANCSAIPGAKCDIPNGVCISCSDGVKNGEESDIDCGGTCSTKCAGGKACKKGGDCENGICEAGKCSSIKVDAADPKELVINEVFDSASASPAFALNGGAKACEFIEIANATSKVVSLEGLSLELSRTDDGKGKVISVPLSGALPAKNLLVVHSCDTEMSLPDDAVGLRPDKGDEKLTALLSLTSTATYDITITNGTSSTEKITVVISESKNKSSFTRDPEFTPTGEMKLTTSIPGNADFATPGYCNNGGQFSKGCISQNTCGNGTKDGTESDVDCGGLQCPKCADAKACNSDNDCVSGFCDNNICTKKTCTKDSDCGSGLKCDTEHEECYTPETCTDNLLNQDETDTDCGGSCSACVLGQKCKVNTDCNTNECTNGTCTGAAPEKGDYSKLFVNEVLLAPKSSGLPFNPVQTANGCKFVEILNLDKTKSYDLDGIYLMFENLDDGGTKVNIPLSGTIMANSAFVVFMKGCGDDVDSQLPAGVNSMHTTKDAAMSKTWGISVDDMSENSQATHNFIWEPIKTGNGVSQTHNPDRDVESNIVKHDAEGVAAEGWLASPGYCANGGLFTKDCYVENTCNNGVKDDNESDVDCGGKCGKCENNKACQSESDCKSGECTAGKCTGEAPEKGDYTKMFINEVLLAPKSGGLSFNPVQTANGCKFVEILNLDSSKSYDLNGLVLRFENLGDDGSKIAVPLSGTIKANNAFVVLLKGCGDDVAAQLPEGVGYMRNTSDPAMSKNWGISIDDDTEEANPTHNFIWEPISRGNGVSQTHNPDRDVESAIVKHNDEGVGAENWLASPGYCVNGALFSNNCAL